MVLMMFNYLHNLLPSRSAVSDGIFPKVAPISPPSYLIVYSHGMYGGPNDLSYLASKLDHVESMYGVITVYSVISNHKSTHDGIRRGGTRAAEEVRQIIAKKPSLKFISFIGFSLGGLYLRYAVKELYNPDDNSIAGLWPIDFVSIAVPHLGVRKYTYISLSGHVSNVVANMIGETGKDLFLKPPESSEQGDHFPVLLELVDEKFLRPLRAFKRRRLYATLRNDFSVMLESASFDISIRKKKFLAPFLKRWPKALGMASAEIIAIKPSPEKPETDEALDEIFSMGMSSIDDDDYESVISRRLNSLGWSKVVVNFPIALPLAHSQITAAGQFPVTRWFTTGGRPVVDNIVKFMLLKELVADSELLVSPDDSDENSDSGTFQDFSEVEVSLYCSDKNVAADAARDEEVGMMNTTINETGEGIEGRAAAEFSSAHEGSTPKDNSSLIKVGPAISKTGSDVDAHIISELEDVPDLTSDTSKNTLIGNNYESSATLENSADMKASANARSPDVDMRLESSLTLGIKHDVFFLEEEVEQDDD